MFREVPLLKVGGIVMTLALALAIVAVVVSIVVRSVPQQEVASERPTKTQSPVERLIPGESFFESWVEKARHLLTPEAAKGESNPKPPGGGPKPGFSLIPEAKPRSKSESPRSRKRKRDQGRSRNRKCKRGLIGKRMCK